MLLPSMPQLQRRSGSFARTPRSGSWTSVSKTIGHSSEMTKKSGDFAPDIHRIAYHRRHRVARADHGGASAIGKANREGRYKGRVRSARRHTGGGDRPAQGCQPPGNYSSRIMAGGLAGESDLLGFLYPISPVSSDAHTGSPATSHVAL